MKKILQVSLTLFAIIAMAEATSFAQGIPFPTYAECEEQYGGRITICHATSSEDNPYTNPTIACEALYGKNGNAGHLDENGTPQAGHENDIMADENGLCPGDEVEPTPTPTPNPSATPEPTSDPEPTATPEPTTTPNPESGKHSSLGIDLNCNNDFDVVMDLTENGNGVEGKEVTFTYTSSKTAKTNKDGRARVSFARADDRSITAQVNDFSDQSLFATMPKDCEEKREETSTDTNSEPESTGQVLGTSSDKKQGQVLGVSTLADTGTSKTSLLSFALIAGLVVNLLALGKSAYAKKN